MNQNEKTAGDIGQSVTATLGRIRQAERQYDRKANCVSLLAVSKTKPASALLAAYAAGQTQFGENYVDEAIAKQQEIASLGRSGDITWHYIGAIQSNKTALLATHFDWIHGIDREKIAVRLSTQRSDQLPELNCCIQINIDNEPGKAGISPDELPELCAAIQHLPNIRLRGLMVIPAPRANFDQQKAIFSEVRKLFELQQRATPEFDTLSMGMSADMTAAIAEGSTLVRIGSSIFGARASKSPH